MPVLQSTPFRSRSSSPLRSSQRSDLAVFLIGFITFSLLYAVQPLLPTLARLHALSSAQSALALSVSTATLALAIWGCAARAVPWDRRRLMLSALLVAALLNAALAFSFNWLQLLWGRALMGLCLGVVPAMAMAHVAETTPAARLARCMALYVAGTALGGMTGRVGLGVIADLQGWTVGLLSVSALCLLGVGVVSRLMPSPARGVASPDVGWVPGAVWMALLRHPALWRLFLCGGLASGLFVSAYNCAGFRLQAAPFALSSAQTGLIFCCYAFGVLSSALAGRFAAAWGARRVLSVAASVTACGVLVTQAAHLPSFVAGLCLMTVGFFAMHAVCSGWVGMVAPHAFKAQATTLYLLAYYLGASLLGWLGGWAWDLGGWQALSWGLLAVLIAFSCLSLGVAQAASRGVPNPGPPGPLPQHDHAN